MHRILLLTLLLFITNILISINKLINKFTAITECGLIETDFHLKCMLQNQK